MDIEFIKSLTKLGQTYYKRFAENETLFTLLCCLSNVEQRKERSPRENELYTSFCFTRTEQNNLEKTYLVNNNRLVERAFIILYKAVTL